MQLNSFVIFIIVCTLSYNTWHDWHVIMEAHFHQYDPVSHYNEKLSQNNELVSQNNDLVLQNNKDLSNYNDL